VPLDKLLTVLNRKLEAYLDRDHQIGHSYLMGVKDLAELRFAWEHKIVPLLQEYFYGDGEKLQAVIGADFLRRETAATADDAERAIYRVQQIKGDAFAEALKKLAGL
jgi:hypothetical protein